MLIFHGYLLRGTGSNVYVASVSRALAALGHDVHLLCQDRGAARFDWVDRLGEWGDGGLTVRDVPGPSASRPGTVTAYLPDIGGLLPVYVEDDYEGFSVKAFPRLSSDELELYISANVAAVRDVVEAHQGVDAALANHLVMGPVICARAGLEFAAKIHGSALSYTVRPNRQRFLPFAREGLAAARGVLVGSEHTAQRLWETLDDRQLPLRTRLGPPGVDVKAFSPLPREQARSRLSDLAASVRSAGGTGFGRDAQSAADAVEWLADGGGPRVSFVGKLIVSKGVDLLLAAWPLVVAAAPQARLLVVGFGAYREGLERLLDALAEGDLAGARAIARGGRQLEGGPPGTLRMLDAFLSGAGPAYAEAARLAAGTVRLSGRLEHEEVARLLPATEATVVPSTFPEAFGMVAAEAAAAGALPICADHSGLHEVSSALAQAVPDAQRDLLSFSLDDRAVESIAARLTAWLELDPVQRKDIGAQLARRASQRWSWAGVAAGVLAAATGELDALPEAAGSTRANCHEGRAQIGHRDQ